MAADEEEIERLVVRITGETDSYQDAVDEATEATEAFAEDAEEELKKVEEAFETLKNTVLTFSENVMQFGKESLAGWSEAEGIAIRLDAAIQANGGNLDILSDKYSDFATEMQRTTTTGDDAALALIQQAEAFGVSGDAAIRAAKNAIALGAAHGRSAESMIRGTAMFEQGNTVMLGRFMRDLAAIKDPAARMAAMQERMTKNSLVAAAEAKTYSGSMKQLSEEYGNFQERIGEVIASVLLPLVDITKSVVIWMNSWDQSTVILITTIGGLVAAIAPLAAIVNYSTTLWAAFATAMTYSTGVATTLFGVLTSGPVLAAAAFVAAIAGAYYLESALVAARDAAMGLNEAQEKSTELNAKLLARQSAESSNILTKGDALADKDKGAYFKEQLETAEKNLKGVQQRVDESKQQVAELDTLWGNWVDPTILDVHKQQLEEHKTQLKAAADHVEALKNKTKELGEEAAKDRLSKALEETNNQLEFALKTAGMTADQIARFKLEQLGASPEELKGVEDKQQQIQQQKEMEERAKETAKTVKEVNAQFEQMAQDEHNTKLAIWDTIDAMKLQNETFGMTSIEADLAKKRLEGWTEAQLEAAKAEMEALDLKKRGKSVTEKYKTEEEKTAESRKELDDLYAAEAISAETYQKGLESLEKQTKKDYKVETGIKGVDAVAAGSAEAMQRLAEFRSGVGGRGLGGKTSTTVPGQKPNDVVVAKNNPVGEKQQEQTSGVLAGILRLVALTEKLVERPTIEFVGAGLANL